MADDKPSLLTRTTECGAPTWSWASVCMRDEDQPQAPDGRRLFFAPPLSVKPLVQNLDLMWDVPGPIKQGNISDSKLTVSGNLLRGYAYCGGEEEVKRHKDLITIAKVLKSRPANKQKPDLHNNIVGWRLRLCAETWGQRDTVILPIDPDTSDSLAEGFVYLLPLAESIGPVDWEEGTIVPAVPGGRVFGLLRKEDVGKGTFGRVGCAGFNTGFLMAVKDRVVIIR